MNEKQKVKAKTLLNKYLNSDGLTVHCEYIEDSFIEFSRDITRVLVKVILCDSQNKFKSEVASISNSINKKRDNLRYQAAAVLGLKFDSKDEVVFDAFSVV